MKSYIEKIVQLQEAGFITAKEMAEMAIQRHKEQELTKNLISQLKRDLLPFNYHVRKNSKGETVFTVHI
jgi:hypothetical protein